MYKIHIKETPLLLLSPEESKAFPSAGSILKSRYTGKPKHLLQHVDLLEKSRKFEQVLITHDDLEGLWADFKSNFEIVEAAGGVIFNPEGKILFIYRRGFWDLPKGKIDEGEHPDEAAIREVEEETGLKGPGLKEFLMPTYHVYREKKSRVLKHTHWYAMTGDQAVLEPQAEEQIDKAEWLDGRAFLAKQPRMHQNIIDLLQFTLDKKSLT